MGAEAQGEHPRGLAARTSEGRITTPCYVLLLLQLTGGSVPWPNPSGALPSFSRSALFYYYYYYYFRSSLRPLCGLYNPALTTPRPPSAGPGHRPRGHVPIPGRSGVSHICSSATCSLREPRERKGLSEAGSVPGACGSGLLAREEKVTAVTPVAQEENGQQRHLPSKGDFSSAFLSSSASMTSSGEGRVDRVRIGFLPAVLRHGLVGQWCLSWWPPALLVTPSLSQCHPACHSATQPVLGPPSPPSATQPVLVPLSPSSAT